MDDSMVLSSCFTTIIQVIGLMFMDLMDVTIRYRNTMDIAQAHNGGGDVAQF
jgi:hypothetical protein